MNQNTASKIDPEEEYKGRVYVGELERRLSQHVFLFSEQTGS